GEPQDEITLLIYPEGRSRFELYDDDGRSQAYRAGHHALTPIECESASGETRVQILAPRGDRAALPPARRYAIRISVDRPSPVLGNGLSLPRRGEADGDVSGWWVTADGLSEIRLPVAVEALVSIRTTP